METACQRQSGAGIRYLTILKMWFIESACSGGQIEKEIKYGELYQRTDHGYGGR